MTVELHLGDCLEVMRGMPENSVDTCITDPPYHLTSITKRFGAEGAAPAQYGTDGAFARASKGFMGKTWDGGGIAFDPATWAEVYRVLKPGAILLAFGGTRTYHRLACAIEDAGFEIRDTIAWVYGSGFPKSYDISKGIDKQAGRVGYSVLKIKREIRRRYEAIGFTLSGFNEACGFEASGYLRESSTWAMVLPSRDKWNKMKSVINCDGELDSLFDEAEREVIGSKSTNKTVYQRIGDNNFSGDINITAPSTPAAKLWDGWGTALKPAMELICVAMKPIDGTYVNNALTWGVAGLWIDGGRVGFQNEADYQESTQKNRHADFNSNDGIRVPTKGIYHGDNRPPINYEPTKGRFPANVIHDGSDEVVGLFPQTKSGNLNHGHKRGDGTGNSFMGGGGIVQGNYGGDSGSAARFFYCAKASRSERNAGLEGMETGKRAGKMMHKANNTSDCPSEGFERFEPQPMQNAHPTVKPLALMRYLARLTKTPTGGVVLDPFMGSGTTGIACLLEGRDFIGIEREPDYMEIARRRIEHWAQKQPMLI